MPGPVFLFGERTNLRTAEQDDIPFLQDAVSDPRIWRAVGRNTPYNLEEEREFFERVFQNQHCVHLLITVDEEAVGQVGFEGMNLEEGIAEINYWVVPSEWGNGYATEAVERLITYGFDQRNLHKIVAKTTEFNSASKRLLEKVGFVEEGVQRDQVFVDGEYQDSHIFGLLREEFESQNQSSSQ